MNVLVCRLSSMGDVILASVVPRYLRAKYPDARITMVIGEGYAALFHDDPHVDRVVAYERDNPVRAVERCRAESWDLVVDLQGNRRSAALVRAIGPVGECRTLNKRRLARALLLLTRLDIYPSTDSIVARYLAAAGMDGRDAWSAWFPRVWLGRGEGEESARLEGILANVESRQSLLGLIPFSAWRNKVWPIERYEAVGRHFAARGWGVIAFGGPLEREEAAGMARRIGSASVSLAGRVSLRQSARALARCRLALGGDTGLTHLARAVGVRTAAIYGATTRHFGFYPFGTPPYRILETPLLCRPCHPHGGHACVRFGQRTCLHSVMAEQAVAALEQLDNDTSGGEVT